MMCRGTKYSHGNFFIQEMFVIFFFIIINLDVEENETSVSLSFCFQ